MFCLVANSTHLRPAALTGGTRPWAFGAMSWHTAKPIDQRYGD